MKTLLLLSVLLCAAFAAPAGEEQKTPETGAEVPQEDTALEAAEPEPEQDAVPKPKFSICSDNWKQHETHCYKFINMRKTWHQAEEFCNSLGGHLSSVRDHIHYNFLQGLALEYYIEDAWLGGFYLQDQWMWIDRQNFVLSYYPSNPSSSSCMYLRSHYSWSNFRCTSPRAFICVKNPFGC